MKKINLKKIMATAVMLSVAFVNPANTYSNVNADTLKGYTIEGEIMPEVEIGRGLYIGHAFNITIHPKAVISENFNIHKGAVIGQQNRGKRKGVPKIGNRVWVGINAVVVGNITIGDDVLIAPLTHVNCDVPSHSIVYGNPCVIKHRENATEGYINNLI